jgi:hypothetical protein
MDKTLEENAIPDEEELYKDLSIPDDYYYPALHIYYNNYQIPKQAPPQ